MESSDNLYAHRVEPMRKRNSDQPPACEHFRQPRSEIGCFGREGGNECKTDSNNCSDQKNVHDTERQCAPLLHKSLNERNNRQQHISEEDGGGEYQECV